jgi:hypothetical protein
MKINQILYPEISYLDMMQYELAQMIGQKIGIKPRQYRPIDPDLIKMGSLEEHLASGTLFVGSNFIHNYATFLSDKPLVVFDSHTDMYNTNGLVAGDITYANWVYWVLKYGREVHLIIQDEENCKPDEFMVPKGRLDNLHLYATKNGRTTVTCVSEGLKKEIHLSKEIKCVKELCRAIDGKIQLSIDLDYSRGLSDTDINEIVKSVPEADTIDVWIDKAQNIEDQFKVCLAFLEKQHAF